MQSRNQSSASLCEFAERFRETADGLFSQVNDRTTPAQFAAVHETLLERKEALEAELKTFGRFHYASASGSLHRCVAQVYEDAKAQLRLLSQLQQPPATPPARRQPSRSPDEVVNDVSSLADEVKRPGQTFLGEERRDDTAPGGNR
jgi:DNA-binding GntR family transcriptional regulator